MRVCSVCVSVNISAQYSIRVSVCVHTVLEMKANFSCDAAEGPSHEGLDVSLWVNNPMCLRGNTGHLALSPSSTLTPPEQNPPGLWIESSVSR